MLRAEVGKEQHTLPYAPSFETRNAFTNVHRLEETVSTDPIFANKYNSVLQELVSFRNGRKAAKEKVGNWTQTMTAQYLVTF